MATEAWTRRHQPLGRLARERLLQPFLQALRPCAPARRLLHVALAILCLHVPWVPRLPAQEATSTVACLFYTRFEPPAEGPAAANALHFTRPPEVSSAGWYVRELEDLERAGIDTLAVVWWADPEGAAPAAPVWPGAAALGRALSSFPELRAALWLEGEELQRAVAARWGRPADLTQVEDRALLASLVDAFFAALPQASWALDEGHPQVFLAGLRNLGPRAEGFLDALESEARCQPRFVVETAARDRTRPEFRPGAALLGPQEGDVFTLGPGYDDARGESPLIRPRNHGQFLVQSFRAAGAAGANFLLLESWNDLARGTALCETLEHGRSYIELTRHLVQNWRAGKPQTLAASLPGLVPARTHFRDREHVTAASVRWRAGASGGGLRLLPADQEVSFQVVGQAPEFPVPQQLFLGTGDSLSFGVAPTFSIADDSTRRLQLRFVVRAAPVRLHVQGLGLISREVTEQDPEGRPQELSIEWTGSAGARPELDIQVLDGNIALEEVALERTILPLDGPRIGLDVADFPAHAPAPAALTAFPWRQMTVPWRECEPRPGEYEFDDWIQRLQRSRVPGQATLAIVTDPPADVALQPGARPDRAAAFAEAFLGAVGPALHALEWDLTTPRGVPWMDPSGAARVVSAVAAVVHARRPELILGASVAPGLDAESFWMVHEAIAPTVLDYWCLQVDPRWGWPGEPTFQTIWNRLTAPLAGERVWARVLVPAAEVRRAPLEALLAPLVQVTLDRVASERALGPEDEAKPPRSIGLLAAKGLPAVHGIDARSAAEVFAGIPRPAIAIPLQGGQPLPDLSVHDAVLLTHGSAVDHAWLEPLAAYLRTGGVVIQFGGAPFADVYRWNAERGSWDIGATLSLARDWREALAIEWEEISERPLQLFSPANASEIVPGDGFWEAAVGLTRRTGQPADATGYHRYIPLLSVRPDGPDVAAQLSFVGPRKGTLLMTTLEGRAEARPRTREELVRAVLAATDERIFLTAGGDEGLWSGADGRPTQLTEALRAAGYK